jgi:hypothetical protein
MISYIDSAKLKLLRAAEHIEEIKNRVTTYAASEPHEIIMESDSKATMKIRFPPHDIAIPIGEALYQMRSALDHLAFGLVKLSNLTPASVSWDKVAFPLKLQLPKGVWAAPVPFGHESFSQFLPGIAIGPFTFIESLQPYYPFGEPNTWLGFLAQLSNIDKHRRLNFLRPRISHTEVRKDSSLLRTLDDGAEVHSSFPLDHPDSTVDVERRFTAHITFNEHDALGDADGLPIEHILESCLYTINVIIVPAFEKFV